MIKSKIINETPYLPMSITKEEFESEIRSQLISQFEPENIRIDGIDYMQEALFFNKFK